MDCSWHRMSGHSMEPDAHVCDSVRPWDCPRLLQEAKEAAKRSGNYIDLAAELPPTAQETAEIKAMQVSWLQCAVSGFGLDSLPVSAVCIASVWTVYMAGPDMYGVL